MARSVRARRRWYRSPWALGLGALVFTVTLLSGLTDAPDEPSPAAQGTHEASPSSTAVAPTPSAQPSETPVPQPTPTAEVLIAVTGWPYSDSLAVDAAENLTVKGRAPKSGYDRDLFGAGWVDIDRNGCDTRNDVLGVHLDDVAAVAGCKVTAGVLDDPYTGTSIDFVPGSRTTVHIDHVVALSDAWQKGAQKWAWQKRVAFANDPLNLLAVDASTNMSKGDGDTATWLPPNKAFRCEYVARQVAVKQKYDVWVTKAEKESMLRVLDACPGQLLPVAGEQSTHASNTGGAEPGATPDAAAGDGADPDYGTCKAAKAAGRGPYYSGTDPEYGFYQDRDNDGVVCE